MLRIFLSLLAVAWGIAGCASLEPRNPVPTAALAVKAEPFNMAGVRAWGDEVPRDPAAEFRRRLPNLPTKLAVSVFDNRPVVDILAISGGGSDGAFGAGVLAGWTHRGDRPRFEVVTGVSAGAIIAPFAFLGPQYDRQIREIWTDYKTNEIVVAQILPGLLGGPALADTTPMKRLIAKYVDRRLLAAIAAEYQKGRILLIGTTNLDAERPVVWNMGRIASSPHPEALDLFRRVIMASAAIPGVFPPVEIKVEVDGKVYEEMHVDGGTTREVFVAPMQVAFKEFDRFYAAPPLRRFFVIKNGKFDPEYQPVEAKTIPIAARAIRTLIKSQNRGEMYRIYRMAKDDAADFNLAAIPDSFSVTAKEVFDPKYQAALFDEGYRIGVAGDWMKVPPDTVPKRSQRHN